MTDVEAAVKAGRKERAMPSAIDRFDLQLASGVSSTVSPSTLAELAELIGLAACEASGRDLLPVSELDGDGDAISRLQLVHGRVGTSPSLVSRPYGEICEVDDALEAWDEGAPLLRFMRRFKDALRNHGVGVEYAAAVSAAFQEVVSNAQEHAKSSLRPLATYEVTDARWRFSVTDAGVGIPDRFRENPRFVALTDQAAVQRALVDGNSTFTEVGRGLGFSKIFAALVNRSARVRLRSATVLARWEGHSPGASNLNFATLRRRIGSHIEIGADF